QLRVDAVPDDLLLSAAFEVEFGPARQLQARADLAEGQISGVHQRFQQRGSLSLRQPARWLFGFRNLQIIDALEHAEALRRAQAQGSALLAGELAAADEMALILERPLMEDGIVNLPLRRLIEGMMFRLLLPDRFEFLAV